VTKLSVNTSRREGCRLAVNSALIIIPTCDLVHPLLLRSVPLKGKQGIMGFTFVSPMLHDEV
jgi:hypothetical protein